MTTTPRCGLGNDVRSPDPPLAEPPTGELRQGDCIALSADLTSPQDQAAQDRAGQDKAGCGQPAGSPAGPPQLYQVIGVDAPGDRCWLRRWPLARHGSPVFELPLRQLQHHHAHRPSPGIARS